MFPSEPMQNGWGRGLGSAWDSDSQGPTEFALLVQVNGETARGIEVAEKLARSTGQASGGFVHNSSTYVYIGMETVKKWRHVDLAT